MEVEIDDYGRIVIPKEVRELLGIESGASLDIRVIRKGRRRDDHAPD
jgi:AbrB family looped-hinge helix DNA binding protein